MLNFILHPFVLFMASALLVTAGEESRVGHYIAGGAIAFLLTMFYYETRVIRRKAKPSELDQFD